MVQLSDAEVVLKRAEQQLCTETKTRKQMQLIQWGVALAVLVVVLLAAWKVELGMGVLLVLSLPLARLRRVWAHLSARRKEQAQGLNDALTEASSVLENLEAEKRVSTEKMKVLRARIQRIGFAKI